VDESDGTDAELLERLASGDQRALAVVFDRHAPAVTRYAWAIAPSRMDVEEIVQDTFLTVWRKAAGILIAETSLLPWLLVTCRNFGMNAVRKAARNQAEQFDDDAAVADLQRLQFGLQVAAARSALARARVARADSVSPVSA
jgi:DNA-directed RNA polymerase specialized sigma24 family protein